MEILPRNCFAGIFDYLVLLYRIFLYYPITLIGSTYVLLSYSCGAMNLACTLKYWVPEKQPTSTYLRIMGWLQFWAAFWYVYIYCMQLTNSVLLKDIQRLSICIYLHLLQHCCMPLASPWYTFDMFNKSINSSNNHRSAKGPLENAAIIDRVSYPKGYDTCMLVGKSVVCVYSLCHREICQMEKGAGHFTLTAVNVSGLYHQHSALIKHFTAAVGNHIQIHESSPTQVHQGSCSYGYHTDPSAAMKHWGINGNVATSPVWPPASVPWAQIISIPTCKHSDMHGAWTKKSANDD